MFVESTACGKMKTGRIGVISTDPTLTKSPNTEVIMARTSLPDFNSKTKSTPSDTPEHMAYYRAKWRCQNKNADTYHLYGGRGIEFRFSSFTEFIECVGERPSFKHSLDRIDNNGHYEPGNVRWASVTDQQRNKRNNRLITHNNETLTATEWSERLGAGLCRVSNRLSDGWCEPCAVTIPIDRKRAKGCSHRPRNRRKRTNCGGKL